MPSDTVLCAAEVAPGKACGLPDLRPMTDGYTMRHALWVKPSHPFSAGRQCQTCGGSGEMLSADFDGEPIIKCPRCIGGVERLEGGE